MSITRALAQKLYEEDGGVGSLGEVPYDVLRDYYERAVDMICAANIPHNANIGDVSYKGERLISP